MDNISHSLAGWALSRAAGARRPRGTTLTLVLASNLPDIDVVLLARGDPIYLLYHRGLTHSLLGLALLPPILAVGLWWGNGRRTGLAWLLLLSYAGVAMHLLYDVATPWGTMLLYPFDVTRFALDWLFIVDLVTWALPLAAILATRSRPERARTIAAVFLVLLAAYGGAAGLLHERAVSALARSEAASGRDFAEVFAFPRPWAPFRWSGIAVGPQSAPEPRIARYAVAAPSFEAIPLDRVRRGFDDPWVRRALSTPAGQAYLWWSRVPIGRLRGTRGGADPAPRDAIFVVLSDLLFRRTLLDSSDEWTPFSLGFTFDARTGELIDTHW